MAENRDRAVDGRLLETFEGFDGHVIGSRSSPSRLPVANLYSDSPRIASWRPSPKAQGRWPSFHAGKRGQTRLLPKASALARRGIGAFHY